MGAVNAIAAATARDFGADALWVSGLEVSASLGLPDDNVLGARDLCDVVTAVRRVTRLPVIVDIDNGGAATAPTLRLARDLAAAGATAICLEDSAFPKHNSFRVDVDQSLSDAATVASLVRTVREDCPDLVVVARTEALIAGVGVDAALARATMFARAGADAVIVHSRDTSWAEPLAVADVWSGYAPLISIPTSFPQLTSSQLGRAGYAMCIYANQLTRASIAAMQAMLRRFVDTGRFPDNDDEALSRVAELMRVGDELAVSQL